MTSFQEPNFPALFAQQFDQLRQFDKDLITTLSNWSMILKSILDGGISMDDNMDAVRVSFVSHATPGTEFSVSHELGKVPTGYFVIGQTGAGTIYDGVTPNTKTTLYFTSDASSKTFRVIVF